ncbi:MAG: UDP-N-acetylglucosamine diphosphorylase/glucosamine-1-phosphate N-acetyltransferase [Acidimicrobiia bacterium]|nr:UDP-N-acetylglucosamine diphosphorylase/glucosamine-1-phosphate N-acetyltransferase [Acidimicrobiia bacterium]
MSDVHIVVLAAGKGTRMKSSRPKVLHHVAGAPMIEYVLRAAVELAPKTVTVVVGHQADEVVSALDHPGLTFVTQEPQLGTAHALLMAEPLFKDKTGVLILLSGDVPLLTAGTLERLVARHTTTDTAATIITAVVEEPYGYGRIVRLDDRVERIVEERDATEEQRAIREINSGIYAFALEGLFDAVRSIAAENTQREYYLPDLVAIYRTLGRGVETVRLVDPNEILGVNSRSDLAAISRIVRDAKCAALMANGVTIEDPATTYVDYDVEVGQDTIIDPGVSLEGRTVIGRACRIHGGTRIVDSHIGDGVTILDHCVIHDSMLEAGAQAGPFAHLRQRTELGAGAKVGNFVEVKKSSLGPGTKAMHLTYLGDAVIGAKVNVGAGTITCNYDGTDKHTTTIEDGAFIGSDTQLIAPVTVGQEAYVGTGTTVRENVPPGALAVSAGKQRNIDGWVQARKKPRTEVEAKRS